MNNVKVWIFVINVLLAFHSKMEYASVILQVMIQKIVQKIKVAFSIIVKNVWMKLSVKNALIYFSMKTEIVFAKIYRIFFSIITLSARNARLAIVKNVKALKNVGFVNTILLFHSVNVLKILQILAI